MNKAQELLNEMGGINEVAYNTLERIVSSGKPERVDGKLIDVFTAKTIIKVADRLGTPGERRFADFLNQPIKDVLSQSAAMSKL